MLGRLCQLAQERVCRVPDARSHGDHRPLSDIREDIHNDMAQQPRRGS
jgi:hypothetical protein